VQTALQYFVFTEIYVINHWIKAKGL